MRKLRLALSSACVLLAATAAIGTQTASAYVSHFEKFGVWEPSVAYAANAAEFHNLAFLLGARRHRMALRWDEIEPNPPSGGAHTYNWPTNAENAYEYDLAAGRRPLIVLYGAPSWAWGGTACSETCEGNVPPSASHLKDWQDFVYQAARTFPNSDLEIWNEPNLQQFWGCEFKKGGGCKQRLEPSPTEYDNLLAEAHTGVELANRDMTYLGIPHSVYVVGGALATTSINNEGKTGGNLPIFTFAKGMIENGAMANLEAFSIHAYPSPKLNPNVEGFDARTLKPSYCQLAGSATGECAYHNWWGEGALLRSYGGKTYSSFNNVWVTEMGASRTGEEYVTQRAQGEIESAAVNWLDGLSKVKAYFVGPLFSERNPEVAADEPSGTKNPEKEEKDWGLSLTEWVRPYGPSPKWSHGDEYAGAFPVLAYSRIREALKEAEGSSFFGAAFDSYQGNGIRFVTRCDIWCVARINSGWVKTPSGETLQMISDDLYAWGAVGTPMSYTGSILKANGSLNYPPESVWRWMTFRWAGAAMTPSSWCVNLTALGWQGQPSNVILSSPAGKTC